MKRLISLCAAVITTAAVFSQTMTVWQGNVSYVYPTEALSTMSFSASATAANTLTIDGREYSTAGIDSITVQPNGTLASEYVEVEYDGNAAYVTVPGNVAKYVTATASGADVSIVATEEMEEEITYRLSGASSNGSFTQTGSYKMTLVLDGLRLTSQSGAAVSIQNGKRINVVLPDGTTTTLADAAGGSQKACFFIKGHAEFSGNGTLYLTGNTKHAYASNEYTLLQPDFGTVNITAAAGDGMHIDQYFKMSGGTVNISGAAGDGIDVDITGETDKELDGQVFLLGGVLNIDTGAAEDVKGVKSNSDCTISGATVTINGTGDGVKGIKVGGNLYVNGAATKVTITETGTTYHKDQLDESKTRGIKVDGDFTFDGGTISVSATGKKAKAIAVDGTYYYKSGNIDCAVDANNVG